MHRDYIIFFLEKLARNLNRDIGDLNNGGCAVLARIMNNKFGFNKFVYIIDEEELENDPPIHILTEIMDNVFFDGSGIHTLQSLNEIYSDENRFFLLQDDESILFSRYDELGEGLGVIDYKEDYFKIEKYISNKIKSDKIIFKFE
ncbi:hypothetical protein EV196_1103 [Mariniflexile fucanivorans]|uniref:Uncharacterized protein n=1 Tax=Mariniflexile fucanivorans TaxID=264023 RepID=A0A4R1RBA3_9FLAO|nr:hypothetical protein [Mariniflexile fucanivorans]TCL63051.1 hypothetical protein EV196_1103 [Mariniflexile fucanivorans]